MNAGFTLISPNSDTRWPYSNQAPSKIDYFFINEFAHQALNFSINVLEEPKLSDHKIVILKCTSLTARLDFKIKKNKYTTINTKALKKHATTFLLRFLNPELQLEERKIALDQFTKQKTPTQQLTNKNW